MGSLLVVVNAIVRSRNRSSYFQGCVIVLLFVALVTVMVIPVSVIDRGVPARVPKPVRLVTDENELEDPSRCLTSTPIASASQAAPSPTHPVVPTIFAITPTRKRFTQLLDLTNLCHTLTNVPHLVWIVVESSPRRSLLVRDLLADCRVKSVHLGISITTTPSTNNTETKNRVLGLKRGAKEKNVGMKWIRELCRESGNCTGVVYFMDDESKYDSRLFEMIRQVSYIGVWPVAFAGQIKFEGPVCMNGSVVEWHTLHSERTFPISSLGFAVNVNCLLGKPQAAFGFAPNSRTKSLSGTEESDFLHNFLETSLDDRLECKGSDKEVYVWQVKSVIDPYLAKRTYIGKYKLRT